jgi:hypothetical protein
MDKRQNFALTRTQLMVYDTAVQIGEGKPIGNCFEKEPT